MFYQCRRKKKARKEGNDLSGFEREELKTRMLGTTKEEKQIIAATLPDEILMEELCVRYIKMVRMLKKITKTVKENSPADYQSEQDYK